MPFKPGESGNPGGRPKGEAAFRERCRQAVDELVIERWINEVRGGGEDWMAAAEKLAAYGYGKPTDKHEHSGPDGAPLLPPMSREEVLRVLDGTGADSRASKSQKDDA